MTATAVVTVIPLGSMDKVELDAAAKRVAKNLGIGVELAAAAPLPTGHFDASRSQSDARKIIGAVPPTAPPKVRPAPGTTADPTSTRAAMLSPMESWGSKATPEAPTAPAGAPVLKGLAHPIKVGVTDADVYVGFRDFTYAFAEPAYRRAIVATKRMKEAFWRRKSDPARQQTRLVREISGAIALAAGAPECPNPTCPASFARGPLDIDQKGDRLCENCDVKLRGGTIRL